MDTVQWTVQNKILSVLAFVLNTANAQIQLPDSKAANSHKLISSVHN